MLYCMRFHAVARCLFLEALYYDAHGATCNLTRRLINQYFDYMYNGADAE
jgi:hypothetical protein